ncbi:hypothetical protein SAMN05216559_1706 [Halomicrobium zhouii]|uniref:Yip1 domain-containing protein n=1 Tax=Halomicrobium zhouii TaxID=767519 RepID=A0A1I6L001_9EURY|nr:hypothetical protein [Halomicrobium zhouii]SFR96777.1 hypothetical protein SAMN05216559_1706 [Halomicrobium zhouii]
MSADDGSPRYDTGYDPSADPHGPDVGVGGTKLTYRRLPSQFRGAESVTELVATIRAYGWLPPVLALVTYGVARGVFEFTAETYAIANGYFFEAWPAAVLINVVFGLFLGGFSWFLYFGVVGVFAGFFTEETSIDTGIFKAGAYLLLVFVPLLAISAVVATTIPSSVVTLTGEGAPAVADAHRALAATPQMRAVGVLIAAGWVAVGFLLLPIVRELYGIDRKAAVVSVLPVTLVAVVATVLV